MTQTPKEIIYIIVIAEAALALIGVSALSLSLFYKTWADPAILTALISITSGLVGSLGTILSNTRQSPPGSTTSQTTIIPDTPPEPPPTPPAIPPEVKITNTPAEPVPVTEEKKP